MKTAKNSNNNLGLVGFDTGRRACAPCRLFIAAFLCTTVVAWFIQLILLPHFLQHLHAGHGMLLGGDSAGMHTAATALAEQIRSQGWSAWELRPISGNAPTGIAAAVYVYLTPEPYMLVPVNALIHASGGLVIYLIVFSLSQKKLVSIIAALPFLMLPSSASWYAQIHKDGIFALGMLLCAWGWMQSFKLDFWDAALPRLGKLILPIALGLFLVWVVRPHIMVLMHVVAIIVSLFGLGMIGTWWSSGQLLRSRALKAVLVFLSMPLLIVIVKPSDYRVEGWKGDVVARESVMRYMPTTCILSRGDNVQADKLSGTVAAMRDFFISSYPNAKSNIDPDFVPGTICNLVTYIPRAIQIGFLAPSPNVWMEDGRIAASTMMRRVLSDEMLAIYVGLLFLPLDICRYCRKPEFWFVLGFFTLLILIHVYLIPNLGTLHRMRYGFLTALVGIAISTPFDYSKLLNLGTKKGFGVKDGIRPN